MPKLYANTDIKHDNGTITNGEEVDASQFTREQLKALYDAGALRVDTEGPLSAKSGPDTSAPQGQEAPETTGPVEKTQDVPAEAKKAVPAKAAEPKK